MIRHDYWCAKERKKEGKKETPKRLIVEVVIPYERGSRKNVRAKYLKRGNIPRGARTESHEE